tara:strand:- start:4204 stop:4419 length:216 start_codon:yes stop_codon:yes gene_type:complete
MNRISLVNYLIFLNTNNNLVIELDTKRPIAVINTFLYLIDESPSKSILYWDMFIIIGIIIKEEWPSKITHL